MYNEVFKYVNCIGHKMNFIFKKGMLLILFIFLFVQLVNAQYANCAAVPASVLEGKQCVPVSSCGTLTDDNMYFLVTAPLTSAGTCFSVSSQNGVLDMNEHTLTYDTGDQGSSHAVHVTGNAQGMDIKNGVITQGGAGTQYNSHAINMGSSGNGNYVSVHDMSITVKGPNAVNIYSEYNGGHEIYNNYIQSDVTEIGNRHHIDGLLIRVGHSAHQDLIYNNTLRGGAQGGILVDGPGSKIFRNDISQNSRYTNDFAIYAWSNPAVSLGPEVYENYVHPLSGRGIQVAYSDGSKVYRNRVESRALANNEEYGGCPLGGNFGLQLDENPSNALVYDNNVTSFADECDGTAFRITQALPDSNNRIFNNRFSAVRVGNTNKAAYGTSFAQRGHVYIENNTFIGDSAPFTVSVYGVPNLYVKDSTFVKGSNPANNFNTIKFLNWDFPDTFALLTIIDSAFTAGTSGTDIGADPNTGCAESYCQGPYDYYINWTLTVQAIDGMGQGVSGAQVTVQDSEGSANMLGTTDSQGYLIASLGQLRAYNTYAQGYVEIPLSPYTITVNSQGTDLEKTVTLDEAKTETFIFDPNGIELTNIQCDLGSGFSDCASAQYGSHFTGVRANCIDTDGYVQSVNFILTNDDTGATIFQGYGSPSGDVYTLNVDQTIDRSGDFSLTVTCTDNTNSVFVDDVSWTNPYGAIVAQHIAPTNGYSLTNGSSFSYHTRLVCTNGDCGDVRATLDPIVSENKPAVASSIEGGNTNMGPENVVDGSMSTRWASEYQPDEWIYIDLEETFPVDNVVIYWEDYTKPDASFGQDYDVQVSEDATSWTTIHEVRGGDGGVDNLSFNSVQARYVKMQGIVEGSGWGLYSIWEMEVYSGTGLIVGTKGTVSTTPGANPFYTTDANPQICYNMRKDDTCDTTWEVYVNGNNLTYPFFVIYDTLDVNVLNIESQLVNITITSGPPPTACTLPYDLEPCDCINNNELVNTINAWYADALTLTEVITNIRTWKTCSS